MALSTAPFPRYPALAGLTWDQCFGMTRDEIRSLFVHPLKQAPAAQYSKLAHLLYVMMRRPTNKASSTAILTTLPEETKGTHGKDALGREKPWPGPSIIAPIEPQTETKLPLGSVHYSPTKAPDAPDLHLLCHTSTDVLGALMSEASHLSGTSTAFRTRTKRNFYAPLIALYSHWCVRLTGEARRPIKVAIATVGDVTTLGSCIPDIPEMAGGKAAIRLARSTDLEKRGRNDGRMRQILEVVKVERTLWDYGNCAETWTFALLSVQTKATLPTAFGVAVEVPTRIQDATAYVESRERRKERYAPLCVNCEKLMKQIVRWGEPNDKVVQNFSVSKWEGPQ